MTEKSVRYLSKLEMLDMLRRQEIEIGRLNSEKDILLQRLDERKLDIQKAGSLAEASLKLSGVMTAAQDAADIYLENVRALESKKEAIIANIEIEVKEKAQAVYDGAVRKRIAAEAGAKAIARELQKLFDYHYRQLDQLHSEFDRMVTALNIIETQQERDDEQNDEQNEGQDGIDTGL